MSFIIRIMFHTQQMLVTSLGYYQCDDGSDEKNCSSCPPVNGVGHPPRSEADRWANQFPCKHRYTNRDMENGHVRFLCQIIIGKQANSLSDIDIEMVFASKCLSRKSYARKGNLDVFF